MNTIEPRTLVMWDEEARDKLLRLLSSLPLDPCQKVVSVFLDMVIHWANDQGVYIPQPLRPGE